MSDLKAAEAALLALEKHSHATSDAWFAVCQAKFTGDPKIIAAAEAKHAAAVAAEVEAGIAPGDVDKAAALVLALRGEQHTEQGMLPPNHGIRTVMAERALAEAIRLENFEGKTGLVGPATQAVEDAKAADLNDKIAHMEASHERSQSEHAEGA